MSGHQYVPQQYTNSAENVIRWSDTIAKIARKTEANLHGKYPINNSKHELSIEYL